MTCNTVCKNCVHLCIYDLLHIQFFCDIRTDPLSMCVHVCTRVCACVYVCMHVCMCVCIYIYIYMYVWIYVCMYVMDCVNCISIKSARQFSPILEVIKSEKAVRSCANN